MYKNQFKLLKLNYMNNNSVPKICSNKYMIKTKLYNKKNNISKSYKILFNNNQMIKYYRKRKNKKT